MKSGKAHVIGTLLVTRGSALASAFGADHSSLAVTGNIVVGKGAVAILGRKVNPDGSGFPCLDDPNMKHPTLTSRTAVSGSITEDQPLAVIIHNHRRSIRRHALVLTPQSPRCYRSAAAPRRSKTDGSPEA